jgi:hypothetical protein
MTLCENYLKERYPIDETTKRWITAGPGKDAGSGDLRTTGPARRRAAIQAKSGLIRNPGD